MTIPLLSGSTEAFGELISRFSPISPDEMGESTLQDRSESKFLLTIGQAHDLISCLPDTYRVFEVDGTRIQAYSTTYYDSPRFNLYLEHHNGKKHRYKVRTRTYLGSDLNFLEVKEKKNTGRTVKHRLQTDGLVTRVTAEIRDFLSSCLPYDYTQFSPVLVNEYRRVTFVSTSSRERLTLDIDLTFQNEDGGCVLPHLVIAELKRENAHSPSPAHDYLTTMRVKQKGFSKYCIGVSLLYGNLVKRNNFNMTLRLLTKIMNGGPVQW